MIHLTSAEAAFAVLLVALKPLSVLLGICVVMWLLTQRGGWMRTASRVAVGLAGLAWAISLGVNAWAFWYLDSGEPRTEVLAHAAIVDGHSLGVGDAVMRGDGGHVDRVNLAEPRALAGISVAGEVVFDAAGRLQRAHLFGDQEIETIPCADNTDADFAAGSLERCVLARAHSLNGIVLPLGTKLFVSSAVWYASLPTDSGTSAVGTAVPGDAGIRYDRVKERVLRLDVPETRWVVIDKLRLTGAIDFTEDGQVANATVFDAVEIGGERHAAGTFVRFRW